MRPRAEVDTDYFPPSEKSGPSTRVPTTPLKSPRPAEHDKRLVGINLLYLVHTVPCAHNFLENIPAVYIKCHIHSLWCHSSCIICCMQAYMYTVSKSPILYSPPLTPLHRHSTGRSVSTSSCSRQRPLREHTLLNEDAHVSRQSDYSLSAPAEGTTETPLGFDVSTVLFSFCCFVLV